MIGKLTEVPLREIWKNEAKDFTAWLEDNIDFVNEELETTLTIISREEDVGPFQADRGLILPHSLMLKGHKK